MREFFKGWRRKVGVTTLMMALVGMGGWLRSLRGVDKTSFSIGNRSLVQLISLDGKMALRRIKSELPVKEFSVDRVLLLGFQAPQGNSTGNLAISVDAKSRADEGSPYRWILKRNGFEIGGVVDQQFPLQVFVVCFPYWSIVTPLTLLSAYLLLTKPRSSNHEKIVEPISDEGA